MKERQRRTSPAAIRNGREFLAWARLNDLEDALNTPLSEIAPWCQDGFVESRLAMAPRTVTISDVVVREKLQLAFLTSHCWGPLVQAAAAYLKEIGESAKAQSTALQVEQATTDQPALRDVAERLHSWWQVIDDRRSTISQFDEIRVAVEDDPVRFEIQLLGDSRWRWSASYAHLRIDLEQPGPFGYEWLCSCQSRGWEPSACSHLSVAVEVALEVIVDPEDELRLALLQALTLPRWTKLLHRISETLPKTPVGQDGRLSWRVGRHRSAGHVTVELRVHRLAKRGGWTKGRIASVDDVQSWRRTASGPDVAGLGILARNWSNGKPGEPVGELLMALCDHHSVTAIEQPDMPVAVTSEPPAIALQASEDGGMELGIRFAETFYSGSELEKVVVGEIHLVTLSDDGRRCVVGEVPPDLVGAFQQLATEQIFVPKEGLADALSVVQRLSHHAVISIDPALASIDEEMPVTSRVRIEILQPEGVEVVLRVVTPWSSTLVPGQGSAEVVHPSNGQVARATRDLAAEIESAQHLIECLALSATDQVGPWAYRIDDPDSAIDLMARLRDLAEDVIVEWATDQEAPRIGAAGPGQLRVHLASDPGRWFAVGGEIEVDGHMASLVVLLDSIRRGRRYVRLGPGRWALLEEELRAKLTALDRAATADHADGLALGFLAASRMDDVLGSEVEIEGDQRHAEMMVRLRSTEPLVVDLPPGLVGELRPYQLHGFQWLARLAAWGAGGILADDMGLGKTVQTLALLLRRSDLGPALVVAPTSVCAGWRTEADSFAPGLDIRLYRGPGRRAMLENLGPGVVLVTSYDLLALDIEQLSSIELSTLVLDEAQAIKNARTRRAKAACQIQAEVAFALTGTPLENHTGDLWSIFRTVCPGLLGSWDRFRKAYAVPIERNHDEQALRDLSRLVRPFLLRRTKAEVAPELPPKTEVVRFVKLDRDERRLYEAQRQLAIDGLVGGLDHTDRFDVLAAILRLRLLACHPSLVDPDHEGGSSKLNEAMTLITDLRSEGQRALVFSQFTRHLALLRASLDELGVSYLYLDGSTPAAARDRLVVEWREGNADLFLLSLKAGGTGLNLMGADMVLHLDPWWNPAVEDQATDRTHRIGQERPVTVVRLISEATIEESVLELHESKRELARGVLDGSGAAATLNANELADLIRGAGVPEDECDLADDTENRGSGTDANGVEGVGSELAETADDPRLPGTGVVGAATVSKLVALLKVQLEEEYENGQIGSLGTVRSYQRSADRFLDYLNGPLVAESAKRTLESWVADYLKALVEGRHPAPKSEPQIASASLGRLRAF